MNRKFNTETIEDLVYVAVEKAIHQAILTELKANKALIASYTNEALSPDRLKQLIKDFVEYDDNFRDAIKEICVEKLTERVYDMVDKL